MPADSAYDDGQVRLDETGITIRRYYFPTGGDKHIPYSSVTRFGTRRLDWSLNRASIWGTFSTNTWMPLDVRRRNKHTAIILDIGALIRPVITPDRPDDVLAILRARVS
ncbi:hypothetical protein HT102_10180 [Hoyosella sp. G463]|uniref:Uncharacterized protein n=1 Tax=Lolliginicoccus lacisalsi TaxID=2742202 RepID=A0A927PL89_9ACTN|nr:hypothetical protein [Lolliginicoccus lacisalsi]MBD8506855.1 hypothetical protein [Lolliginicoccus lacisalsi]